MDPGGTRVAPSGVPGWIQGYQGGTKWGTRVDPGLADPRGLEVDPEVPGWIQGDPRQIQRHQRCVSRVVRSSPVFCMPGCLSLQSTRTRPARTAPPSSTTSSARSSRRTPTARRRCVCGSAQGVRAGCVCVDGCACVCVCEG